MREAGWRVSVGVGGCGSILLASLVIAGDSAAPFAPFTEEAQLRGVDYTYPAAGGAAGWGLAFGDLDGDLDPDLVAVGALGNAIGLWENDGAGYFTSRASLSGIPPQTMASSVLLLDYDRDGDLDIFIGRLASALKLYRNDGHFSFTDVTSTAMAVSPGFVTGCAAADFDGNGYIDLYVSQYGTPNRLLLNDGGVFTEALGANGANDPWNAWQAVVIDIDDDGRGDIYTSNDKKVPNNETMHNRLYLNTGGAFIDVSRGSGTNVNAYSMGLAVGDINRDGREDVYCANLLVEPGIMLVNQGDGSFIDMATEFGVENMRTAWATLLVDFNNDRWLDLFVCNHLAPNRLYLGGAMPWPDIGPDVGASPGNAFTHCAAAADIDGDGDIDLAVQNDGDILRLLINQEGSRRGALQLRIAGAHGEPHAIGAVVAVRVGEEWTWHSVRAGGNGFKGQNDLLVHAGLGDASHADQVIVTWPDGQRRTLVNVPAKSRWTVWPLSMAGDLDNDTLITLADLAALLKCGPGPVTHGCEKADLDGNFVIDAADIAILAGACIDSVPDCDGDGIPDAVEILLDPQLDADGDLQLDDCASVSPLDLDGDGSVGGGDLGALLASWGACGGCPADFDGNGIVDGADLGVLLTGWSVP